MSKVKLAELLLRRKELTQKVEMLSKFKENELYENRITRRQVSEGVDDIIAKVAKLTCQDVMYNLNGTQKQLRLCDALIQQANWTHEVELTGEFVNVMNDLPEKSKEVLK